MGRSGEREEEMRKKEREQGGDTPGFCLHP